jgi:hypothetical protein
VTDTRLTHLLTERGLITTDGITRRARAHLCPTCRQPTIAGLDHDRTAATARCDPQPLNALGELAATLTHRQTYSLTWRYNRWELDPRWPEHITAHPAGQPDNHFDVLAEHTCPDNTAGTPPEHTTPSRAAPPTRPPPDSSCPY